MTIKRTYFEDDNFVLTHMYGKLTAAELGQHVLEMNSEYKGKRSVNELADCRFLTDVSELSTQGVISSAQMQKGAERTSGSRGGIVVASDAVYGLARAYSVFSQQTRIDSRVFRSVDEAVNWLGIGHLRKQIEQLSEEIIGKI